MMRPFLKKSGFIILVALPVAVFALWGNIAYAEEAALNCGIFVAEGASAPDGEDSVTSCVDVARESFTYLAEEARDPFESLIIEGPSAVGTGKTPPELYDINMIKLKAVVNDGDDGFALVQLPDSKHYIVELNSKIGTKGGTVIDILDDRIIIRQTVEDYKRQKVEQTRELKLREEEEE